MEERERREKLQKLIKLEKIYIDVMYFRFLDKTVPEIARVLNIGNPGTVYTRFTKIYEFLEIKGDDKEGELIRQFSPLLLEFIKSDEDLDNWGRIRGEMLRQINAPNNPEGVPIQTLPTQVSAIPENEVAAASPPTLESQESPEEVASTQKTVPSKSNPPWIVIGGLTLLLCLACVFGSLFLSQFRPDTQPSPTSVITLTNTIFPTHTLQALTETSIPPLTDTPLPPTPSATSTNTALPTLSPTASTPALFTDDFNNGKAGQWQLVYGSEPIIVNGSLTFNDDTLLMIDAKDWTDYEVSFYVSNMSCQEHVDSRGLTVGLRLQDANNMVALRINDQDYCGGTWVQIQNSQWNKLPNTDFKLPKVDSNGGRQITIRVQGNTYSTPIGTSVVLEGYPSGGIALISAEGVTIDNVKIIPINP